MKNLLYYIGLIAFAFFEFTIHSKYLHFLVPRDEATLFVFANIDFKIYLPYMWGIAFGIISIVVLHYLKKTDRLFWWFAIPFALLIGVGVYLFNNTNITKSDFKFYSSAYYAIYAAFAFILYAYIKEDSNKLDTLRSKQDAIADVEIEPKVATNANAKVRINRAKVAQMLQEKIDVKNIALELNANPATIYRIKKELENEQ